MDFEYDGKILKFDKALSELDKQVVEFVKLLDDSKIKYVIVSGYVSILFGRSRTTEDIDVLIEKVDLKGFQRLFNLVSRGRYWIIDSNSREDAFDRLKNALSIRIAKKGMVIPNFEVKFAKKKVDFLSLDAPLTVLVDGSRLLVSRLEIQIPFKIWLASDKDIEDALHIYELFKERLDRKLMSSVSKELKIENEMIRYGII